MNYHDQVIEWIRKSDLIQPEATGTPRPRPVGLRTRPAPAAATAPASAPVKKKQKQSKKRSTAPSLAAWLFDSSGSLMAWKNHPRGNYWNSVCLSCELLDGEDPDPDDELLLCYYCNNAQHADCVLSAKPGLHPEHDDEWICPTCYEDYEEFNTAK